MNNLYEYVKAYDDIFEHKKDKIDVLSILFHDSDVDDIDMINDDDNNDHYNDAQITFDLFADPKDFICCIKVRTKKCVRKISH